METGDAAATAGEKDWAARAGVEKVKQLTIENEQRSQDLKERKNYAHRIFCLTRAWIASILIILIFQGFSIGSFRLADSVLIAVVGTTTASVLGIFLIVANYLFPKR